ncbi:DUF262 domain-containing protein [Prevotella brunnea]|uniref:DUF262 domain-containing protein n=1 Tax=Prevotella brunnea TaxID=2508867 RepID=UPI00281D0A74|nr:DUF262 domain-containing HNH endonuclease family protein [Prevotella brunnea]MDR0186088.1 DUF262 domain-containing protein [Prevotella brunnea]
MATANINVNKQNVLQLLTSGQEIPFVIPEYQRPYSWSDDEIITLFEDLWEFSIERTHSDGAKSYFLGCVVSYEENGERQIIDGQQRITSLFLLLRAVFSMLEKEDNKTDEVNNFIQKIKPALWKENEMTGKEDRSKILLRSEVVTDSGNLILRNILESGEADKNAKDNYSKNYNKFKELYIQKSQSSPNQIYHFVLALLNYSILLPITADDQETALTIFNTLNNRGLPLSDADIFKSYIYKKLDDTGKKAFINKWKKLETDAEKVNESIQSLFYYNMFYMRAREKDDKSTTPGVRKYYLDKNKNRLTPEVIDDLAVNLQLWKVINGREAVDGEEWCQNMDIRKILDSLSSYTNEFWKYPVSIFFMEHKDKANFEEIFLKFLRKLYVMLLTRYLEVPTINAVKVDILKLNVQIINNSHPEFYAGFEEKKLEDEYAVNVEKARTDKLIIAPHKNMVRMLLKVLAYQENTQTDLLPGYWEIEHIFPQTWDSKYYTLNEEEANEKLEHLGNKLPLEKKLNISASNNYFAKKKDRYKDSKIAIIKKLGDSTLDEWNLTNIDTNDTKVCEIIKGLLKAWVDEYEGKEDSPKTPEATPEELAMIKMLKEKGLI